MNLYEEFKKYLNDKPIDVLPIGGFTPGRKMENLFEADKSQEDEDIEIHRNPILFDEKTIGFINQFPPEFHKKALSYLYNDLIFHAKELEESGKPIPSHINVHLKDGSDTIVFKDIKTYMNDGWDVENGEKGGKIGILHELEKPVDREAFKTLTPEDKHKYTGGLYGYDLSGKREFTSPKGDLIRQSAGYSGLAEDTAMTVLANWRTGTPIGLLGKTEGSSFRHISYGGGRKKTHAVDWNGKVHEKETADVLMPTVSDDELRKNLKPSELREPTEEEKAEGHGIRRIYRYYKKNGTQLVEKASYVPLYKDGKHVKGSDYASIKHSNNWLLYLAKNPNFNNKDISELESQLKQEIESSERSGKKYIDDGKELFIKMANHAKGYKGSLRDETMVLLKGFLKDKIENAKRYDIFDFNVHKYNKTKDDEGNRLFTPFKSLTVNPTGVGTYSPNYLSNESIPGTKEEKEIFEKFFLINKNGSSGKSMYDLSDLHGEKVKSYIIRGIESQMKTMGNTPEYIYLSDFIEDIADEYVPVILQNLSGSNEVKDFVKEFKKDPSSQETQETYQKVASKVVHNSAMFMFAVSQLDWGRGTRRTREGTINYIDKMVGEDGGVSTLDVMKIKNLDTSSGYTRAAHTGSETKEKEDVKNPLTATGGRWGKGARGQYFGGRSKQAIIANAKKKALELTNEIINKRLAFEQSVKDGSINKVRTDGNDAKNNIEKELMPLGNELMNTYEDFLISYFIAEFHKGTPKEKLNIDEAISYAGNSFREFLISLGHIRNKEMAVPSSKSMESKKAKIEAETLANECYRVLSEKHTQPTEKEPETGAQTSIPFKKEIFELVQKLKPAVVGFLINNSNEKEQEVFKNIARLSSFEDLIKDTGESQNRLIAILKSLRDKFTKQITQTITPSATTPVATPTPNPLKPAESGLGAMRRKAARPLPPPPQD